MNKPTPVTPTKPAAPTRVVLGPRTRFSYCNVWEPRSINGGNPKYSMSAIIPKDDTVTVNAVNAAIESAYREGEARLKGKGAMPPLSALKTPLRDGDLERPDDPAYAGCWFLNANSDRAPGIVDAFNQAILNHSEVYSGCYGRVSVTFFAFNSNGNRGIACGLNNIQKLKDGEPLGGHISAEQEFAAFAEGSTDEEDFLQ
jgi:hypothetical protein